MTIERQGEAASSQRGGRQSHRDEVQRGLVRRHAEETPHGLVIKGAYNNTAQLQSCGLQADVLSCMPRLQMHISDAAFTVFGGRPLVLRREHQNRCRMADALLFQRGLSEIIRQFAERLEPIADQYRREKTLFEGQS